MKGNHAQPAVSEAELTALHGKLAETAAAAGLLDVAYTTIDSPVGTLLLAASEQGLVKVAFERQNHDTVLDELAAKLSPRVLRAPARLSTTARELDEYFAGRRKTFDLRLDHRLSSGFRQLVQRHLPLIPYGRTESYREVAEGVGNPKAVRAVGTACATNPLPIVVPCHRVVRSDGSFGEYAGGPEAKAALLRLEGVAGKDS
ncbi:methylated-DNA--[protein]-cysteine S-methyltransferase [Saccharomonospora sp. NPDC006951]